MFNICYKGKKEYFLTVIKMEQNGKIKILGLKKCNNYSILIKMILIT